jgi:hypothetical protein
VISDDDQHNSLYYLDPQSTALFYNLSFLRHVRRALSLPHLLELASKTIELHLYFLKPIHDIVKMSCLPFNLLTKLISRTPADPTAAKRDARIKQLKKLLSKHLKASSSVNHDRAEKLVDFMEAEETRLGLLKKNTYSEADYAELKKPLLPVESEALMHEAMVGDEVDGMKLVKWQLWQVSYLKSAGGLMPREVQTVFEEKNGDLGEYFALLVGMDQLI